MRRVVSALATMAVTVALATAQAPEWADKLFPKDGTTHNFGNVPRGALLSHRFPITNIYAVPLEITATRASCGCVTITPSAKVIQPRETAYLDVTMDGRRFTGPKTVSIYVSVGPQYTSTATLQVSATARADVVFNPGQVSFGVVPAGQAPTQTIEVEYAGNLDWKIDGIAETTAPLETKIEELYRQAAGPVKKVGYRLSTTLKPTALPGTQRWELLLQTNDPASPTVPVLVEAIVQAALAVAPNPVNLAGQVGQPATIRVVVKAGKPFRILGVDGQGDGLMVEGPEGAKPTHLVTIKWQPEKAGDVHRELRFKTDLDGGTVAPVQFEGTAVP